MRIITFDRRNIPYYRTPATTNQDLKYQGTGIAPHARTQRGQVFTTSPTRPLLAYMSVSLATNAAPGTAGIIKVELEYTNPDLTHVIHTCRWVQNTTNGVFNDHITFGIHVLRALSFRIFTTDLSVGGSVDYDIFVGIAGYLDY